MPPSGGLVRTRPESAQASLHLLIGALVATFGSVLVLLPELPATTLVVLIVLKTLADLAVEALLRGLRFGRPPHRAG